MISTLGYLPAVSPLSSEQPTVDSEIVEIPLLLPRWQIVALETIAAANGLTTGQMLRRLIGESIAQRA